MIILIMIDEPYSISISFRFIMTILVVTVLLQARHPLKTIFTFRIIRLVFIILILHVTFNLCRLGCTNVPTIAYDYKYIDLI